MSYRMVGSGPMYGWREKKEEPGAFLPPKRDRIAAYLLGVGVVIVLLTAIGSSYDHRFATVGGISMALLTVGFVGLGIHALITETRIRCCPTCDTMLRLDHPDLFSDDTMKHRCDSCGHCEDTGIPDEIG